MNEARYLQVISGTDRSLGAAAVCAALRPLSWVYAGASWLRQRSFDWDFRSVHKLSVPVVSVGNLTTGGTGKTPIVALLVRELAKHGARPGIISRGYRSLEAGENDEKRVLALSCPGVPHLQDPDRVAIGRRLLQEHPVDVIVADDAFQHRRLARDLDVVLIDALNPFGYDALLPRGLLREPKSGLARADVIILTRADLVSADQRAALWREVSRWKRDVEPIEIAFEPSCWRSSDGSPVTETPGPAIAFCGIGNPDAFRRTLARKSVTPAELISFSDHHHYSDADYETLRVVAKKHQASSLITTTKDLVKLNPQALGDIPVYALEIEARVITGSDLLQSQLEALLHRNE